MGEVQAFFLRLGIAFAGALFLAAFCTWIAGKKGRDRVGWFLNGLLPALVGLLIVVFAFPDRLLWILAGAVLGAVSPAAILLLPALETPGQTRRCGGCGELVSWKAVGCAGCGAPLEPRHRDRSVRVKRPLRTFYLILFFFLFLLLIVFGFIGYYCVPDQPRGPAGQGGHSSRVAPVALANSATATL